MRVKFVARHWGQVDMECKSAYPQFGFFTIRKSDEETIMVPSHLIESSISIVDPDPLKHVRVY